MKKKIDILNHAANLDVSDEIKPVNKKNAKRILKKMDSIVNDEALYKNMPYLPNLVDKRSNLTEQQAIKLWELHTMTKRRSWHTYNELCDALSDEKESDVVYALFRRLADIALGDVKDTNDSAKYAVLLLNTMFDEKRQLQANTGFKMPIATISDVNKASQKVMELLGENVITIDVADRFHKLLQSRIAIIQDTDLSIDIENIKSRVGLQ